MNGKLYSPDTEKAVGTIYLEEVSTAALISNTSILSDFKNTVNEKNTAKARAMQRELVELIMDNKLLLEYMNRLF